MGKLTRGIMINPLVITSKLVYQTEDEVDDWFQPNLISIK
jgi:hypothetical protein